jgi:glycosyltransferase involved in cell wall biosynthesis
MLRVTVVVCTYNRAASLRDTLQSLIVQQVPSGVVLDILVIDNNSRDETVQVVDEISKHSIFPVRRIQETRQGIGWARNRGLKEAAGDYILFIDDDAVAAPDWAVNMVQAMEASGADFMGGRITPLWMADRPSWLEDNLCGPIVRQDYGAERRPVKPHEGFLTANVVFRKKSIEKYGPFDSTLGRKGDRWIGGEDFELFSRWLNQGAKIYYEPSAVVQHKVEASRITPEFYRKWFVDIGLTQGHQLEWKNHYRWMILPLWRWKLLIKAGWDYFCASCLQKLKSEVGSQKSEDRYFQAEIWWIFQKSFFGERLDHWMAKIQEKEKPNCRYSKI